MKKMIIFGFGGYGKGLMEYYEYDTDTQIVAVADNYLLQDIGRDPLRFGIPLISPADIKSYAYDTLLVSNIDPDAIVEITKQLKTLQIPENKISYLAGNKPLQKKLWSRYLIHSMRTGATWGGERIRWLCDFACYAREANMPGNVAECGVYYGDFSFFINKYFPDRILYLFDTFEGFAETDLSVERELGDKNFLDGPLNKKCFADARIEIIENIFPHIEKCVIKKGFFPETTAGLEDTFCFVNLDMDLYQPMLAGIEWFYPRMEPGGVILLHDYWNPEAPGVKRAVHDYEQTHHIKLHKFPIGDFFSLAILKS